MGDSIGIGRLFLAYAVGGILVYIVNKVGTPILDKADAAATGTAAQTGNDWLRIALDALPLVYVVIGFIGIIAYTVFRRSGGYGA